MILAFFCQCPSRAFFSYRACVATAGRGRGVWIMSLRGQPTVEGLRRPPARTLLSKNTSYTCSHAVRHAAEPQPFLFQISFACHACLTCTTWFGGQRVTIQVRYTGLMSQSCQSHPVVVMSNFQVTNVNPIYRDIYRHAITALHRRKIPRAIVLERHNQTRLHICHSSESAAMSIQHI